MPCISVNGKITSPEEAMIPALDRGFLFGDNVFETFVAFHGKILDLDRHLARLRKSAAELMMEVPFSDEELIFELQSLAEKVGAAKTSLRLVITRGEGLGLKFDQKLKPNKIIYCTEAPKLEASIYSDGISLKRMASPFIDRGPAAKTGNYLRAIVALLRAERAGMQDILWTNSEKEITEASTANIFFIGREGDNVFVKTPPAHSGILLGITRETIMQLLNNAKIPVSEEVIFADELPRFDEAFVCSTVRGLVPVNQIDNHKLPTMRKNSIFQHIDRLYLSWVESQLGFRVDWNSGEKVAGRFES